MKFEWDARKSVANRVTHGIDFETAKALWLDENRIEIAAPHPVEDRNILIAHLDGKLWTAVYTMRGGSTIRLISVRPSRGKEEALYAKERTG